MIIKCAFFFSLLRAAIKFDPLLDRPLFLAAFYTAGIAFLSWAFPFQFVGDGRTYFLIGTFLFSALYFWMLRRFEDAGFPWWVLLLGGAVGLMYW